MFVIAIVYPLGRIVAFEMSIYSKRIAALGAKIFGEITRPTSQPAKKVYRLFMEKPLEKDPQFTEYYPRHIEISSLMKRLRAVGLYRLFIIAFFRGVLFNA